MIYITYFCESKYKHEFLQIKYNRKLKNEFKQVIEIAPEAIVIFDPKTKEIVMDNSEFEKLVENFSPFKPELS